MNSWSEFDSACMARALQLAAKGRWTTRPNPAVGCVIACDGEIVGEGFHQRSGEPHAEVIALQDAGDRAAGATAYVTLEPCSHSGKTPPCADALIRARLARVVVAAGDPSDKVNGTGIKRLRDAGITVETGLMAAQSESLNAGFFLRANSGRPRICAKIAMSLDGATAMKSGESQWITSPESRADVQRLRALSGAILTGIGTVLADDPSLNLRDARFKDVPPPLRVIADAKLRMPQTARMLSLPGETLIATTVAGTVEGADVLQLGGTERGVDLHALFLALADRDVNDVLVEAGPILTGSLLQAGLIDELVIYQAPLILGSETRRFAETADLTTLAAGHRVDIIDERRIGPDRRLTVRLQPAS